MKVLCSSLDSLPNPLPPEIIAFTFFESGNSPNVGRIAHGWPVELRRAKYAPSTNIWDFVLFSLAVCAADLACLRRGSADGWTRKIELSVTLNEPAKWLSHTESIQGMLRILTGDFWIMKFLPGGPIPPQGTRELCDRDCVSLLSGGLDSLIGGIDLHSQNRAPIFVSQLAHEDSARQRTYATELGGGEWHQQWSHKIGFNGPHEPSTRARSMAFYGFAVLASSLIQSTEVDIFVPENGFISLNPPLLPGRMASLSTRTTHPLFMSMLQNLLTAIGINVRLQMPYRFKTKGEMLKECGNQTLLSKYASDSTSCGRFRTYNRTHCGRCVPCMIRKAAFMHWDAAADTTTYKFKSLTNAAKSAADDPMAAACAVLASQSKGIDSFLGATLSFADSQERSKYRDVAERGLVELGELLKRDGVL
ncbi:MAG: Qat anti-phage system QueC-like protein QatC [Undibacterium sp.]|uniref:Qat anti-phage system QueC-like protein QatC n=1 Tax=Undibacterium sp. TaxID=1914977 RepID=UPI00272066A7|nr:Qat anti-phage system QueC-like protein QatC [Undibacterium sp.]MDO8653486.1 Qat anti-phage system QueC-like protein QatC [Undibacterium sp.]